jgi:hypothetical protein
VGLKEEVNEIKKEVIEVRQETFASEILKDYKKQNKRLFIITIVILVMWFITIGYLVYVLNDIGTIETTSTQEVSQENTDGYNNYIGNDGDINNG